jgi:hypothetical protein
VIAGKLQIKPGMSVALVGVPEDVHVELPGDCTAAGDPGTADAVLVFARDRGELAARGEPAIAAGRRDALAWVAYPKAGQLGTDLNRDTLAAAVKEQGVQPVRQVAIDDVWSALRLRPAAG